MAGSLRIKSVYHVHKYVVSFFKDKIHTTVTSDCDTVMQWIKEIEHPNLFLVGFDIQYRYSYLEDFVSTVQFCIGGRCLIYQLEFVNYDFPDVLLDFLANEEYTFVGLNIARALTRLEVMCGLDISREMVVDLRDLTEEWYYDGTIESSRYIYRDTMLEDLVELVLDKTLEYETESVMVRKWSLRHLTSGQVKHACVKAFVAFEIGRVLNARQYRLTATGNRDSSVTDVSSG